MTATVHTVPALSDNYVFVVHSEGKTAVVDPGEAAPVRRHLEGEGAKLDEIWLTHKHFDHVDGVAELRDAYGCKVYGPEECKSVGLDGTWGEGDEHRFADLTVRVLATPGHTPGHVTLVVPEAKAVFPGDVLFVLGCGRLSEAPSVMWESLRKLKDLPTDTRVYCGHEYTLKNAEFALSVDPDNEALQEKTRLMRALRDNDQPTVPSLIGEELAANPFLRPDDQGIRAALNMADAPDADVFAELRRRKDRF